MTARRFVRRLLGGLLALTCAFTVLTLGTTTSDLGTPELEPAADLSQWKAGNIISDAVFYDSDAMTAAQVKDFLAAKGANCRPASGGPACIKDLVVKTPSRAADAYCGRYEGASESAAAMIKKVGVACGINPRVLMVMLQKEQGIITQQTPTAHKYSRAMGFGCPDSANGGCDALFYGLFNQVYNAARQFKVYAGNPGRYGHKAGMTNAVRYSPDKACGSSPVFIENQATASLYNYTPYQPTKAALNAGYAAAPPTYINGVKHYCGAYGNRNFYSYFTDWFGSTRVGGRDVDAPVGRLEAVVDKGGSVLVRGWAFDPNSPTAPVQVNVFAGGTRIGTDVTDLPRSDVAAANPGAGSQQGFEAKLALTPGRRTVCVYPVNIGAGASNPRLGCKTLTITTAASWNPKGKVTDIRVSGTRLVVQGWAFDPDAPKYPSTVRVYAGRLRVGDVVADDSRSSVARAYPAAGRAHGFTLNTRLTKGTHRVCAYAMNKGSGTGSPRLGCTTVTVTARPPAAVTTGNPLGRLSAVALQNSTGQDAEVTGWTFDPDAPTAPTSVRIYAGTTLVGTADANGDRAGVQRLFPHAGSAHGFTWRGVLPHGSYDVCVHGVNRGAGIDVTIGCTPVTVIGDPAANPRGVLDALEFSSGTVRADGWAYDPDNPTAPVTVRITRDGGTVAEIVADGDRPGLSTSAPVHQAAGDAHGYVWSGAWPPGTHTICAEALNVGYGSGHTQLKWCRTETVPSTTGLGETDPATPPDGSTTETPTTDGSGGSGEAGDPGSSEDPDTSGDSGTSGDPGSTDPGSAQTDADSSPTSPDPVS